MGTSVTEIAVDVAGALHEIRVSTRPGARLADVAEAIEPCSVAHTIAHTIAIDGVEHPPNTLVADAALVVGSTLRLAPVPSTAHPEAPVARLALVAGLRAGITVDLRPGTVLLGAAPGCDIAVADPAVSSNQALLHAGPLGDVSITDLAAANPACVSGVPVSAATAVPPGALVRVGNHLAVVEPPAPHDRAALTTPKPGAATVGFHRPPRHLTDESLPPVRLPEHRPPGSFAGRVGLLSAVVMLVGGVAAFAVMRSPLTLIFVGLGATGALASAAESRRQARREARSTDRRQRRELHELRAALAGQARRAEQASWRAQPHLAEITRRALTGSARLWERRTHHGDAFLLTVGVGARSWTPAVVERGPAGVEPRVANEIDASSVLQSVPVTVALARGQSVGVGGDRGAALAVTRSLMVQAAVLHGPADLTMVVASSDTAAWDWAKWLPHTVDPQGGRHRLIASTADDLDVVLADLPAAAERDDDQPGRGLLLVVDGVDLIATRTAALRSVVAGRCGPARLLVIAPRADALPADCAAVVEAGATGRVRVVRPADGDVVDDVLAAGCDLGLARRCARALARWHDPELDVAGAALPAAVSLLDLLGPDATDAAALARRWGAAGADPAPRAPVAMAADGVVELDLVRDGPHGLVAGTTGSGKSELLRSVVAGLASRCSPRDLTFVLVDYKGGSAFDLCARLPHTVGLVTDLDGHLAERALRSLEAELTYRERLLRDAGATDLPAYRRLPVTIKAPLPRLAVVIDEFATLASELPDFVDALVGIAQRGRSLGVHLLLATQRPSGAVSDNIRANANLRIALRVHDAADSSDVLDSAVAAQIPRGRPGRMWLRLGPSELIAAQSARATGPARPDDAPAVTVEPFVGAARVFSAGTATGPSAEADPDGLTELALLVAACTGAAEALGLPAPRRPWLDALPSDLSLSSLPTGAVALADVPDEQTQPAVAWDPDDGNLLLYGITGSGTTTTIVALALALVANAAPGERHLYVLDMGAGDLVPLRGLPHVGAVVTVAERERQWRLVRMLKAELDRRRAQPKVDPAGRPAITLLIDGYGALAAEYDDLHGQRLLDDLARVITDGPEVRITCAIVAERPGALPFSLVTTIARKWLFTLADAGDYASYGIRGHELPTFCPGRAVVAGSGVEIQIANPGPFADAVAAAARWASAGTGPAPIGTLPGLVASADLPAARCTTYPWVVPIGIGDQTLAPVALTVHEGEHVLIAGPSRSGRTTALATIAASVRAARPDAHLVVMTPRRSPLADLCGLEPVLSESELETLLPRLPRDRPVVLLVDDCESLNDDRRVLARFIEHRRDGLHVVAAGHADQLRLQYGHWTNLVRGTHTGVLLRPNPDIDGDLLQTLLPRQAAVALGPGRGYLVNEGVAELVQVATGRPA